MMNPKVDFYFKKSEKWQKETEALRALILDCGLAEELKWGCPCYLYQKKNVVLIHVFKEYCALLFFNGALLRDSKGILVQQTKNVQAARQMRFTNMKELLALRNDIKAYVFEAIEAEKMGLKVELKKTADFPMPAEFKSKLEKNKLLKTAFYKLTPGRQRAYLLFFDGAKQSKTRETRIEKCIPQIVAGKGLND
jgi:uncharacterized protein YdeI (YjbR/CyaY-like superfamily)